MVGADQHFLLVRCEALQQGPLHIGPALAGGATTTNPRSGLAERVLQCCGGICSFVAIFDDDGRIQ